MFAAAAAAYIQRGERTVVGIPLLFMETDIAGLKLKFVLYTI